MATNLHIDWETVNTTGRVTEMQSPENWAEAFTKTIGHAIDQARHGKSDQWIANQTKELGQPISRTAISEYRRGVRKNVPVTDLIVIARVLRVPPIYLLFPDLPEGPSFPFPGQPDTAAVDGMRWFTGESEWETPISFYGDTEVPGEVFERIGGSGPTGLAEYAIWGDATDRTPTSSVESDLVWLTRSLVRAYGMLRDSFGSLSEKGDLDPLRAQMFQQANDQITELTARIKKLGGTFRSPQDGSGPDHG